MLSRPVHLPFIKIVCIVYRGAVEWDGDWSDNSSCWTPALRSEVGQVTGDDGAFWISFADLAVHFSQIYICHVPQPSSVRNSCTVASAWTKGRDGGSSKYSTHGNNPQFALHVPEQANVRIFLVLADPKARRGGKAATSIVYPICALHVRANKGCAIDSNCAQYPIVCTTGSYSNASFSVEAKLDPTPPDAPYTLIASTLAPDEHAYS